MKILEENDVPGKDVAPSIVSLSAKVTYAVLETPKWIIIFLSELKQYKESSGKQSSQYENIYPSGWHLIKCIDIALFLAVKCT